MKCTITTWAFVPLFLLFISGSPVPQKTEESIRRRKKIAIVISTAMHHSTSSSDSMYLNNANDMTITLSGMGFQVVPVTHPRIPRLTAIFDSLQKNASSASVIFFYFSGHGFNCLNQDFISFLDIGPDAVDELPRQSLSLYHILKSMSGCMASTNIVVLDACLPVLPEKVARKLGNWVKPLNDSDRIPNDFFIIRSDGIKASPSAGHTRNSLFTDCLVKHMQEPGLSLDAICYKIIRDVRKQSDDQQIPVIYSTMGHDIFLSEQTSDPHGDTALHKSTLYKTTGYIDPDKKLSCAIGLFGN